MTETAQPDVRACGSRETVQIRVSGTVQGVGFRPTVWRLARDAGVVGEVLNDASGVLITTTGDSASLSQFLQRLQAEAPPLSRIEAVETRRLDQVLEFSDFQISASGAGDNRARVTPDAKTCRDCREEILNRGERYTDPRLTFHRHNFLGARRKPCAHPRCPRDNTSRRCAINRRPLGLPAAGDAEVSRYTHRM
jgi:hydrogenase maturation protein HypF